MIPPKTCTSPCSMPFPAVLLHGISPDTHHLQALFEAQHAGEANSVVPGAGHACGPRLAYVASILSQWYSTKRRTASKKCLVQAPWNFRKRLISPLLVGSLSAEFCHIYSTVNWTSFWHASFWKGKGHSPNERPAVAEQRSTTSGFSKRSFSNWVQRMELAGTDRNWQELTLRLSILSEILQDCPEKSMHRCIKVLGHDWPIACRQKPWQTVSSLSPELPTAQQFARNMAGWQNFVSSRDVPICFFTSCRLILLVVVWVSPCFEMFSQIHPIHCLHWDIRDLHGGGLILLPSSCDQDTTTKLQQDWSAQPMPAKKHHQHCGRLHWLPKCCHLFYAQQLCKPAKSSNLSSGPFKQRSRRSYLKWESHRDMQSLSLNKEAEYCASWGLLHITSAVHKLFKALHT